MPTLFGYHFFLRTVLLTGLRLSDFPTIFAPLDADVITSAAPSAAPINADLTTRCVFVALVDGLALKAVDTDFFGAFASLVTLETRCLVNGFFLPMCWFLVLRSVPRRPAGQF